MRSVLIRDTTRREREEIVRRGLGACGGACGDCSGCDVRGGGRAEEFYRPYIEGEKELAELNESFHSGLVR